MRGGVDSIKTVHLVVVDELRRVQTASRLRFWDVARGFAILTVIVGHVVQRNVSDCESNLIFRLIYSFHMPLFMFISGSMASSKNLNRENVWAEKFTALVVPFIAWAIVYFITDSTGRCSRGLSPDWLYFWNVVKSPDWGLWFLWVLFLCFGLLCAVKLAGSYQFAAAVVLYCWLVIVNRHLLHGFLGLNLLLWQVPYFFGGYFISQYFDFAKSKSHVFGIAAGVIYFITFPFWRKSGSPSFYEQFGWSSSTPLTEAFMVTVSLSGVIFVLYIIRSVEKIIAWMSYLGVFTLEIYCCHAYFIGASYKIAPDLGFGIGFLLELLNVLMCSIVLIALTKQSKWLNRVLYGK